MSKRKQGASSSSGDANGEKDRDKHALVMAEQRLFDVQCYAHDVIAATSALSEGGGIKKSTRAYYDPLLNMEIQLLREREEELLAKIDDLKRGSSQSALPPVSEELNALRRENEELRNQFGDIGRQMQQVRVEMSEARVRELQRALGEANKFIEELRAEKETSASEIFALKARVKDMLLGGVQAAAEAKDSDSDSDAGGDQFSSFFAAAKNKQAGSDSD